MLTRGRTRPAVSDEPGEDQGRRGVESLKKALAAAEAACRARDELLSMASHALRTPLTAILGWVTLLRGGGLDPATTLRAIDIIERNARRQADLIGDVLDATRILTGRLRLNRGRVDLRKVVEAALAGVASAAEAKQVRLHVALDPAASELWGDADRLQQVVATLIANAVKFTGPGGRIQVRLARVGSHAEVDVQDEGAGIADSLLPHLFDRLPKMMEGGPAEEDPAMRAELGLGLSIAHHLAELHGGSLTATSEGEGRGATFTLRLPLYGAGEEAAGGDRGAGEPSAEARARLQGLRVLLVGDPGEARDGIARTLADLGGEVATAGSSAEAVRELAAFPPDVMVIDLEMQGEDGYQVIRQVRALGPAAGGRTPAVALSAYDQAQDRVRTLRAGFHIHAAKPVPPLELATAVASLGARSPRQSARDRRRPEGE